MQDSDVLRATSEERQSRNDTLQHEEKPASSKMSQTLGNLDALLGIEEEKKAEPEEKPTGDNVRHYFYCYYCYTRPWEMLNTVPFPNSPGHISVLVTALMRRCPVFRYNK